jgi:hypothetical protein
MRIRYKIALVAMALTLCVSLLQNIRMVYLSMGTKSICPKCGSGYIRLARTPALIDRVYRLFGLFPYRCHTCDGRFHRPKISV